MKMKTNKRRKLNRLILVSVLVMLIAYGTTRHRNSGNDLLQVEVGVFELEKNTWGYEIWVDKAIFIRQEYIPAIPGNQYFLSKEDAIKTGNAVMQKLLKGQRPTLSSDEVIALGVVPGFSE